LIHPHIPAQASLAIKNRWTLEEKRREEKNKARHVTFIIFVIIIATNINSMNNKLVDILKNKIHL
jgi:hypothetical protein